mgnify:CR=1 FL=1
MVQLKLFLKNPLGTLYHLFIIHPYAMIRHLYPVWFYISNRASRKLYRQNRVGLNPVCERIAREFKDRGIAFSHLDELFQGENMLAKLQKYTASLQEKAEVKNNGKKFLRFLWDAIPALDLENPYVQLAFHPNIHGIMNEYLGLWAKFYFFTLNVTVPVAEGAKPVQSQRWHRDSDDKKVAKFFIYLNDVDEGAGPFMAVLNSHYGGKWRYLFPQRPPHGSRAPASGRGGVDASIPKEEIRVCTGRAGTVIFCDTTSLHKGGYATQSERIMFTGVFASSASYKYTLHQGMRVSADMKKDPLYRYLSPAAQYAIAPSRPSWLMRLLHPTRLRGKPEKDY